MEIDYMQIAGFLLAPLTGVVSWFAGRRTRAQADHDRGADVLENMQQTIDLLVEKNNQLYAEVLRLRDNNMELKKQLRLIIRDVDADKRLRRRIVELEARLDGTECGNQ